MINLSIVIPIYNESKNIKTLITGITDTIRLKNYEILFIDDDSRDETNEILSKINKVNEKVKFIIRKNEPRDLSRSCILGFKKSLFENILVMDGDLQHDPKDINVLINAFENERQDIVIGSRNLFYKRNDDLNIVRLTASKAIILIINLFLQKKTNDPLSGFFIFKKEIYSKNKDYLFSSGYKILADLIYSSKENLKIKDVDINFRRRKFGSSKMSVKVLLQLIKFILAKTFYRIKS